MQGQLGTQPLGIERRHSQCAFGQVCRMYISTRHAQRHRNGQTAAATAHVQRGGGGAQPQGGDGPFSQQFRFRTGNEHPLVHVEIPAQEALLTRQIL